jgi:hypothetical protein
LCAALLILLLAGCARDFAPAKPAVGPWSYDFQLGQFRDERKDDDTLLMSEPFTTDGFMRGWHNSVGRAVFANVPAKLDVTLRSYETTSSGDSYSVSMDVALRGRDMEGHTLAVMNGKCDAIVRIDGKAWWDFGQQARAQGAVAPLTAAARNATMWQKVMDSCVAELAKQFDTSLAAGAR